MICRDHDVQYGAVRWIGKLSGHEGVMAGVELDNSIGSGTGRYNGVDLFTARMNHAALIPIDLLIRAVDFDKENTDFNSIRKMLLFDSEHVDKSNNTSVWSAVPPTPIVDANAVNVERSLVLGSKVKAIIQPNALCDLIICNGVVRWLGRFPDKKEEIAGLELDRDIEYWIRFCCDGTYNGRRYFVCDPKRGVFVTVQDILRSSNGLDLRRTTIEVVNTTNNNEMPVGASTSLVSERPLSAPWNASEARLHIGKPKGIQGKQNSCYLDSTLFALFAGTDSFDNVLSRPRDRFDSALYEEIRQCLKFGIVDVLRRNGYVPSETTMRLRRLLAHTLPRLTGITTDEKDPEEFVNILFAKVLRAVPDIRLSTGQTEYIYPVVPNEDFSNTAVTTVQKVLERNFAVSGVKLISVPDRMMVQLPRFGNKRICEHVVPSPRLKLSKFLDGDTSEEYLELAAVICIESSHYVSFVRIKEGYSAKWLFFNSMADREGGDVTGHNLPQIIECDGYFENLLWPHNQAHLFGALTIPDDQKYKGHPRILYPSEDPLPDFLERLLKDVYICVYTR